MEDRLIELLETINKNVFRQGSVGAYPDSFFTFWCNDSFDGNHYDNQEISVIESFDVNAYSTDPATTYSMLAQARTLLKQNGFIISGTGYDVPTDEVTHTGRGMTASFNKYKTQEETQNE